MSYRPTPLERAHATHLLVTYFNTPVELSSDDGEMRVSGRDAVPFLTSSGVDRSLLRLIWSVADPEGVGTLTVRNQFHTILRLIAMAQANFLPPLLPGMENQHTSILQDALVNNSHLVMALPTFSRDGSPPTVAYLLGTYPTPVTAVEAGFAAGSASNNSQDSDVSTMLTNHDLQYQLWQKQQQQMQHSGGDASWGNSWGKSMNTSKMSVDDAFGSFVVEDRPLPSLEYQVKVPEERMDSFAGDKGEKENNTSDTADEVNDDDFGDFDGVTEEHPIAHEDIQPTINTVENKDHMFGDFEETSIGGMAETASFGAAATNEPNSVAAEISEDEFQDVDAAPNNVLGVSVNPDQLPDSTNQAIFPAMDQHGPTLSISDAFDSLVVEQETPQLTSMDYRSEQVDFGDFDSTNVAPNDDVEQDDFGGFESNNVPMNSATIDEDDFGGFESTNANELDEHDDFGGFESTDTQPWKNPLDSVSDDQGHLECVGDQFGEFESNTNPQKSDTFADPNNLGQAGSFNDNHHPTLSISDAFDSLVPEQEVPLVPLEQKLDNNNAPQSHIDDDEVEFGIANELKSTMPNSDQSRESTQVSSQDDNPLTQLNTHAPTLSISHAFDSLVVDQESQAVPFYQSAYENQCEDYGSNLSPEASHNTPLAAQSKESCGSTENDDSAKDSIVEEKKTGDDETHEEESLRQMMNDNETTVAESLQGFHTNSGPGQSQGLSAFDDIFGGIEDAPLPPLEAFSPAVEQGLKPKEVEVSDFDDSFGDFEGNAVVTEEATDFSPADDTFGHFDSLPQPLEIQLSTGGMPNDDVSGAQDAPMQPYLEAFPQNHMEDTGAADEPEFDEFEGIPPNTDPHEGHVERCETTVMDAFANGTTDDDFGNFEDVNSENVNGDTGAPTNEMTHGVHDDDFGGFSAFDQAVFSQADGLDQEQAPTVDNSEYENAAMGIEDDDFGEFSTFDQAGQPEQQTPVGNFDGAFSSFEDSAPAKDEVQLSQDTSAPLESYHDDSGDFATVSNEQFENNLYTNKIGGLSAFGSEGTASNRVQSIHPETTTDHPKHSTESNEDFGDDFGDFSAFEQTDPEQLVDRTEHLEVLATDHASESDGESDSRSDDKKCAAEVTYSEAAKGVDLIDPDHFGDFTAFGSAATGSTEAETVQDNYFVTSNVQLEPATELQGNDPIENIAGDDDFGDFDAFESADNAITEEIEQLESATQHRSNDFVSNELDDDNFGDFNAFESPDADDTIKHTQNEHSASEVDDFGDFAAGTFDAEFGEFEEFDSAPPNGSAGPTVSPHPHADLRERMHALEQLGPPLPSNDTIIEYFEKCSSHKESPRKQLLRCVSLCEILAKNPRLSQQWESAISSIKSDLERARKILDFFSDRLSSEDRSIILRSRKLSVHILGLAEFVRVARYITSSLRDMLCLEANGGLDNSPREWKEGKLMTNSAAIDEIWLDVCSVAIELDIISEMPRLESIAEIRAQWLQSNLDELCQLTLQPISRSAQNQGTRSFVSWTGNHYMAVSANFLANRLSQQRET